MVGLLGKTASQTVPASLKQMDAGRVLHKFKMNLLVDNELS